MDEAKPSSHGRGGLAQINGISLRYRIDGVTGPWVAFSNSLLTDLRIWDDVTTHLSDRYRILRYDHCGHGGSESRPGTYTFDQLGADLVALLDHLDIQQTHIVGISMGGNTGASVAHRHPERVRSLTMCDCQQTSTLASREAWLQRRSVALENGMAPIIESAISRWFDIGLQKDHSRAATLRGMMAETTLAGYVGSVELLADYNVQDLVESLQLPILLMAGERDGTAPHNLAALATRLRQAEYFDIPNAGHISCVDNPPDFARRLKTFLDSQDDHSHAITQKGRQ